MLNIIFELGQILALGALVCGAYLCIKECGAFHESRECESFREAFGYTPGPQN